MTIAAKLTKLADDITDAYEALDDAGATMPAYKNTENLDATIRAVAPTVPKWGTLYYYSSFTGPSWSDAGSTNIAINSIDVDGLANFVEQRLYGTTTRPLEAYYWMDNNNLMCSWVINGGGWQQFSAVELNMQYGINIGLVDTTTNGHLLLNFTSASVDKTSQINSVELSTLSDYESLATQNNTFGSTINIGTATIMWGAIQKFVFGINPTTVPDSFLYGSGLEEVDLSHAKITAIGNYFLGSCESLDSEMSLPNTVTTIGNSFLSGCKAFDFAVIGRSVTTVGSSFLSGCSKFNSRVLLPVLTSVGNYFMSSCSVFNHELSLPALTTINGYFLQYCSRFNSAINLPEVTTIYTGYFLRNCTTFNQPISLPKVTTVANSFLYQCSAFNNTVSLPAVVTIGNEFIRDCTSFNTAFTLPNTLTSIGNYFLYSDAAFNKAVTIPSSVTTIGNSFMGGCSSFNKSITFPATVSSMGKNIMFNCNAMVSTITLNIPAPTGDTSLDYSFATSSSTAACYTTGITLAGTYASAWRTKFPNRTSSPYRKTILSS